MSDSLDKLASSNASEIVQQIRSGQISALTLTNHVIQRINDLDERYNSFTLVTQQRACQEAKRIDSLVKQGMPLPPLAGVPYAVKNLFDITDEITLAGSKINQLNSPATADAFLVQSMHQAGAILVGALNMDEYAYGFTTENSHYGPTRNPHDPERSAGGSSGGCGAAVAAGFVPLSLGSDTNGSVRVPSSMCGIFGLKPTYGRLSLTGMYPFVHSLDHAGIFARNTSDLKLCYEALDKNDGRHHHSSQNHSIEALKIGIARDYFEQGDEQANSAVKAVSNAFKSTKTISLPEVDRARSAAYLITAMEGGALHLNHLKQHGADFDPHTYPRLVAGALAPGHWYIQAQRFRRWFYEQVMTLFKDIDIIIAPATPCSAPLIGQETIRINGKNVPTRPNIGIFTQPISFIGLPVVTVPIFSQHPMPIGVQIIAAPWCEDQALAVAAHLEAQNIAVSKIANH